MCFLCLLWLTLSWWSGRSIRKCDPVHSFPIIRGHHLDRVPRTAIEERPIRTLARTLLTSDAEVRINFDSPERRMVFVRHPEHAGFNRTILNTRRRSCAARATISRDCQNAWPLFTRGLSVALRHGPVLVYDVVHGSTLT
jgi:hypothetical protein